MVSFVDLGLDIHDLIFNKLAPIDQINLSYSDLINISFKVIGLERLKKNMETKIRYITNGPKVSTIKGLCTGCGVTCDDIIYVSNCINCLEADEALSTYNAYCYDCYHALQLPICEIDDCNTDCCGNFTTLHSQYPCDVCKRHVCEKHSTNLSYEYTDGGACSECYKRLKKIKCEYKKCKKPWAQHKCSKCDISVCYKHERYLPKSEAIHCPGCLKKN
jgi:hypothetical protein